MRTLISLLLITLSAAKLNAQVQLRASDYIRPFLLLPDEASAQAYLGISGGSGDVVGPASATDNALARFDSTTGKLIQNSLLTLDDTGNLTAGDASQASSTMTFNLSGATDPLITAGNDLLRINSAMTIGDGTQASRVLTFDLSGTDVTITTTSGTTTISGNLVSVGNITLGASNPLTFSGRSAINSASSGVITLNNSGLTDFTKLQLGPDDASPGATPVLIQPASGVGTDVSAQGWELRGGAGTGTGRGGIGLIKSVNSTTTGASAGTPTTRAAYPAKYVTLTEATATTIGNLALANNTYIGAELFCTVFASDGTEYQSISSRVSFDAVNKAGAITIGAVTQTDNAAAPSAGTLTPVTYTAVANGASIDIKVAATSSLTQTVLRGKLVVVAVNSDGTAAFTEQ